LRNVRIDLEKTRHLANGRLQLTFYGYINEDDESRLSGATIKGQQDSFDVTLHKGKQAIEELAVRFPGASGTLTYELGSDEMNYYFDGERSEVPGPLMS